MSLNKASEYVISFHVQSSPKDFDFTATSGPLKVTTANFKEPVRAVSKKVQMKFRESCSSITGKEPLFTVVLINKILSVTENVSVHNVTLKCGSIIATFNVSGPYKTAQVNYVDLALEKLYTALQNSLNIKISGTTYSAAIEMKVDGKDFKSGSTGNSNVSEYYLYSLITIPLWH